MLQRRFLKYMIAVTCLVLFCTFQALERFFVIHYDVLPSKLWKNFSPKIFNLNELNASMTISKNQFSRFPRILCGCHNSKKITAGSLISNKSKLHSSCSLEAAAKGPNQNIVSFSLFLESENAQDFFIAGISPNLKIIKEIYPDWLIYIYTKIPINKYSCDLICDNDNLFWCLIDEIPEHGDLSRVNGRVWRFLPIGDSNVDTFISRDLDSVPSIREKFAVDEWLRSNMTFHVMRDSQWHDTEILAGLWGAKNHLLSPEVKASIQRKFIVEGKLDQKKSLDQELLREKIFYPFKNEILAHDGYFCDKYDEALTRPFPTKRNQEEFVGHDHFKEIDRFFVGRIDECPEKCRPPYGKDWTFC